MMITLLMPLIMAEVTGASGQSVTFKNPDPCALKGSSVEFRCYTETVLQTQWYKTVLRNGTWKRVALSSLPSYKDRTEDLGDQQHNCSLAIHDLQGSDTGYYFYGWHSKNSVYLSVTELKVTVRERVTAGDQVTLGCGESCELPNTIWFRDGHPVTEREFTAQAGDSGNYFCAVKGKESVQSDSMALDVQYPPLNVSIVMSHPRHLEEGGSVNLTCSSVAHPPTHSYTWYKKTDDPRSSTMLQVGSGKLLSLPSVQASHTGLYICQARNSVGQTNSTEVLLRLSQTDISDIGYANHIRIGVVVLLLLLVGIILAWRWRWYNKSAVDKEEEHTNDNENMRHDSSGKNGGMFQEEHNNDYEIVIDLKGLQ